MSVVETRHKRKRIVSMEVINAGSSPDVDSDFSDASREPAIRYVTDLYGEENVANINTFGTLAAKGAIKAMCSIYGIPPAEANKLTKLIPPPIEGKECTVDDLLNPDSLRYDEAGDFRSATSGGDWEEIIDGARKIEGRNRNVGIHASGIVISSEPIGEHAPLRVDRSTGKKVTQWSYSDCEAIGLIKMDFLGLDTVDIIQGAVQNIIDNGKEAPNMIELMDGPMDDPDTYKLFQDAKTVGIFQFGSSMVRDLLKQVKPTEFEDLAATTAIARPGPMGMNSHIKYADRKNNREEIETLHPDFKDSPLDEILGNTYGLVVYQEQVIQIANRIGGMTLQEGDDLRKAMGKKKIAVMEKMKPKFYDGGQRNGYSAEALDILWNTIAEFAKYGFNKSHSVAYAMNSYQAAWLKTHYTVEFMASLINRAIGKTDKFNEYLREARAMGIAIKTPDVNLSASRVTPDFTSDTDDTIMFGLSGVQAVSEATGDIIVKERKDNGEYTSVQDFVRRTVPLGISKTIIENLTLAGAFDSFGASRKQVVENINQLIAAAKNHQKKGNSLFDMFEVDEGEVDVTGEEFDFPVKMKRESDMVSTFLSDHPLKYVNEELGQRRMTLSLLRNQSRNMTVTMPLTVTGMVVKTSKNKSAPKGIILTLDDGHDYIEARVDRHVVMGIEKTEAYATVKKLYIAGEVNVPTEVIAKMEMDNVAQEPIVVNTSYTVNLTYRPARDEGGYESVTVNWLSPMVLDHEGKMPVRIRVPRGEDRDRLRKLAKGLPKAVEKKVPGEYAIYRAVHNDGEVVVNDQAYQKALDIIMDEGAREAKNPAVNTKDKKKREQRSWPPAGTKEPTALAVSSRDRGIIFEESLNYVDTGNTTDKSNAMAALLDKYLGYDSFDYGLYRELEVERD